MSPEHVMGLEKSMAYPCLRPMDESVDAAIPKCQTPVRSGGRQATVGLWSEKGPSKRKQIWRSAVGLNIQKARHLLNSLPFRGCCGNTTSSAVIPHHPSKTELTACFSGRNGWGHPSLAQKIPRSQLPAYLNRSATLKVRFEGRSL